MLESIILGIVQGLTEFLPVSSSGHLVIFHKFLGNLSSNLFFDVILHFGTFLATLLFFRRKIAALLTGGLAELKEKNFSTGPNLRQIALITLAVLPAVIIGGAAHQALEDLFQNPKLTSGMLLLTGSMLGITFFKSQPKPADKPFTPAHALLIGMAQALAIIPGLSRSGLTICTALLLGRPRTEAGEFSFLISLPVIFGAVLFKIRNLPVMGHDEWINLGIGFVLAFLVGLAALTLLMRFVRQGRMWLFAPYLFILGIWGLYSFC